LNIDSTNVVIANAASPSGAGFAGIHGADNGLPSVAGAVAP
jgi:hypothetical protein